MRLPSRWIEAKEEVKVERLPRYFLLSLLVNFLVVVAGFILMPRSLKADDRESMEVLSILGRKESLPTRPGSAHILTEKEMADFAVKDIHRILQSVPGVNVQEEDGFGLRPNIGLRGAHPHRSKKITMMEDGVLIGPAPYAAPAAYYFPQLDKISAIEVFKGTPAVMYGPNSVGGALNLVTKQNPTGVDFSGALGSFDFRKYDLSVGVEAFGDLSFDFNRMESTGFKVLPSGNDTGFVRNNATLRWDKHISTLDQNITFKLNWSDEVSDETYLGLTDADFANNPNQRYAASESDRMQWEHKQAFLSYALSPSDSLRGRLTVYRHEFSRGWFKFNGFYDDPSLSGSPSRVDDILKQPDLAANNYFYQVISGQANSGVLSDNLDVIEKGDNYRTYVSQGVQTQWDYEWLGDSGVDQVLTFFYRFHSDSVNRNHVSSFFNMTSGQLIENNTIDDVVTKRNEGRAQAQTFAVKHSLEWGALSWQNILRYEHIRYEEDDFQTDNSTQSSDNILAPGTGIFYQAFDQLGFLFGVHKGFTPVGPGQVNVDPEEAINYELGLRHQGLVDFEIIGFYSDYTNILGTCTFSTGCDDANIDSRFNGGEASVKGVEFLAHKNFRLGAWTFPMQFNATYNDARFANSFVSSNPEWGTGTVQSGDPIPYIPDWQGQLSVGVMHSRYSANIRYNYLGLLADQAVALNRRNVPSRSVVDINLAYRVSPRTLVTLRVDNVFGNEYAVSYRPQGLRPGRPQSFILGFNVGLF